MNVFTIGTRARHPNGSWATQDVRQMTDDEIKGLAESFSRLPARFSEIKYTEDKGAIGADAITNGVGRLEFFAEVRVTQKLRKAAEALVADSIEAQLNEVPASAVVRWTIPLEIDISNEGGMVRVACYARGYLVGREPTQAVQ